MKKAWYNTREGMQNPINLYLISMILLGISNTFSSATGVVKMMLDAARYTGGAIKVLFPLFVVINVIGKRHEDSVPIIGGVMSYVVLEITTMFTAPQGFAPHYYTSFTIGDVSIVNPNGGRLPLNTGLIGSAVVIFIVISMYRLSRKRFNYGILRFIDNDTWFILLAVFASIIAGFLMSFMLPYFVAVMRVIINFVKQNSNNPAALFIYGLSERSTELMGLDRIFHNNFWFEEAGGSWLNAANNVVIYGDVNIWTEQFAAKSVLSGVGKYITPFYIINLVVVPATVVCLYFQYSSKVERQKMLGVMIIAILTSLLAGTLLPLEYFLLIISPVLLIIFVILTSTIYGAAIAMEVWLGYSFSGDLAYATPGTLKEFISISEFLSGSSMKRILILMAIFLILSIIVVFVYYNVLALDFLDSTGKKRRRKDLIRALGGIQNIGIVDYNPYAIMVSLYNPDKIDKETIMECGGIKITEAYFYDTIEFGPGAVSMGKQIKKEVAAYRKCLEYIEN